MSEFENKVMAALDYLSEVKVKILPDAGYHKDLYCAHVDCVVARTKAILKGEK